MNPLTDVNWPPVAAAQGTHQQSLAFLHRYLPKVGAKVLDLPCGAGAFALRGSSPCCSISSTSPISVMMPVNIVRPFSGPLVDFETVLAKRARINAPIGLNLGSKTPAEIALAVLADILRARNGIERAAL